MLSPLFPREEPMLEVVTVKVRSASVSTVPEPHAQLSELAPASKRLGISSVVTRACSPETHEQVALTSGVSERDDECIDVRRHEDAE
jgi:hypothetical protein